MFGHWIFFVCSLLFVSSSPGPAEIAQKEPELTSDIIHFVPKANDYGWQVSPAVAEVEYLPSN